MPNYGCARKYGEGWLGFRTSFEHIWYFSMEALRKLAVQEGFRQIYWETSTAPGNIPGQLSKVEELWIKLKKCIAIERKMGIKELIRDFLENKLPK